MDLFATGPATSALLVLALPWNSQWDSPDRKNLKPPVERIWLDVIENIRYYTQQS